MARDGRARRSANIRVSEEPSELQNVDAISPEDQPDVTPTALEPENSLEVPSEVAQEIWESLREEFYEQIEQLPLSLHRSFALIGEQDREVQACQAELLPTIRSYVKLRQFIQAGAQRSATQCREHCESQSPHRAVSIPSSMAADTSIQLADPEHSEPKHKEEDLDVTMEDLDSQVLPEYGMTGSHTSPYHQSPVKSTSRDTSSSHAIDNPFQSAAARTQGLRQTDATVPKSVPFPPRQKPKTTRELLTRISFLTGELLRASEEKVGLATAAYDSVDRHVRALDAAIKEHEGSSTLGFHDGTHHSGKAIQEENGATINEEEGEDDEEPQLGMVGPGAETEGRAASRLRRNKKRDRRDQRKHILDGQPPPRVHPPPATAHQDMPIDPHEPRYCYCNQVSYGEMIACDNPNCSREWFHLGCAGLAAPPKGKVKWYCRDCEEALGRNRRRRVR